MLRTALVFFATSLSATSHFCIAEASQPAREMAVHDRKSLLAPSNPVQRLKVAQASQQSPDDASGANFWASIRDSNNPALFEEFLIRFPNHAFSPIARSKLESLRIQQEDAVKEAAKTATPEPVGPPTDLASELQIALQNIGCYTGGIDGDWGRGSRAALQRFNTLSGNKFLLEPPSNEAIAAVKAWRGESCKVIAAPSARKPARRTAKKRIPSKKRRSSTAKKKPSAPNNSGVGVIIGGGRGRIGIGIGGGIRF